MSPYEPQAPDRTARTADAAPDSIGRLARIIAQAARFEGDTQGMDKGEQAALARLDPDGDLRPHQVAALTRALLLADIDPAEWGAERWQEQWRRWALIAHGMALAGHDPSCGLGTQLHSAKVAESRVTKLLTARNDAFRQLLPRLIRLLKSQETAPNWHQLGTLVLNEGRNEPLAERIRLHIASDYYRAERRSAEEPAT